MISLWRFVANSGCSTADNQAKKFKWISVPWNGENRMQPRRRSRTFKSSWLHPLLSQFSEQQGIPTDAAIRQVSLRIVSTFDCQAVYGFQVTDWNICTSGQGGVGICGGDSGGPLYVVSSGRKVLVCVICILFKLVTIYCLFIGGICEKNMLR